MYIDELREVLQRVNILDLTVQTVNETSKEFVNLNKDQLWDGKKATGADITPSYLDDPYFKSRKQAEAYASWKQRITPNSKRNKYAPNLFINGYYYASLQIGVSSSGIMYAGWGEVLDRYEDTLGLTPEHQTGYNFDTFLPVIANKINELTGLALE